jgi:hypothetical protein
MIASFLVIIAVLVITFDVIALNINGLKGTISYFLYVNSQKYPIIAFAIGVLCGHLFWQMNYLCG